MSESHHEDPTASDREHAHADQRTPVRGSRANVVSVSALCTCPIEGEFTIHHPRCGDPSWDALLTDAPPAHDKGDSV